MKFKIDDEVILSNINLSPDKESKIDEFYRPYLGKTGTVIGIYLDTYIVRFSNQSFHCYGWRLELVNYTVKQLTRIDKLI